MTGTEVLKESVLNVCKEMYRIGLVRGTSGNVSARDPETGLIAIKPSGVPYDDMKLEDIVVIDLERNIVEGSRKPSSEVPMHTQVYKERKDVNGIVHTHSLYATAFASVGREIPALNIMSVAIGGSVPVAEYATPGSEELGREAVRAIGDRKAVLLKNHGVLAIGATLSSAFGVAIRVEEFAHMSFVAFQIGDPISLTAAELKKISES